MRSIFLNQTLFSNKGIYVYDKWSFTYFTSVSARAQGGLIWAELSLFLSETDKPWSLNSYNSKLA